MGRGNGDCWCAARHRTFRFNRTPTRPRHISAARGTNHADEALLVGIAASFLTVLGQGIVDYTLPNSVIFFAVWALIGAVLGISNTDRCSVRFASSAYPLSPDRAARGH